MQSSCTTCGSKMEYFRQEDVSTKDIPYFVEGSFCRSCGFVFLEKSGYLTKRAPDEKPASVSLLQKLLAFFRK